MNTGKTASPAMGWLSRKRRVTKSRRQQHTSKDNNNTIFHCNFTQIPRINAPLPEKSGLAKRYPDIFTTLKIELSSKCHRRGDIVGLLNWRHNLLIASFSLFIPNGLVITVDY
jgi:hypothetical protein